MCSSFNNTFSMPYQYETVYVCSTYINIHVSVVNYQGKQGRSYYFVICPFSIFSVEFDHPKIHVSPHAVFISYT
uniref:Uncharacterized protein n=1 Tax=Pinctada fucata TaxID=50426 RepID=A0A194ANQ5_PINFU